MQEQIHNHIYHTYFIIYWHLIISSLSVKLEPASCKKSVHLSIGISSQNNTNHDMHYFCNDVHLTFNLQTTDCPYEVTRWVTEIKWITIGHYSFQGNSLYYNIYYKGWQHYHDKLKCTTSKSRGGTEFSLYGKFKKVISIKHVIKTWKKNYQ